MIDWDTNGNKKNKILQESLNTEKTDLSYSCIEVVSNRIYFYGKIINEHILKLNKEIRTLNTPKEGVPSPEYIYLNIMSPGGSIFAGLSAMDEILTSPIPVITVVDGLTASAGTLLSIVGKKRQMKRHSYILIHQLSSGMWGKYSELEDEKLNLDNLMRQLRNIYKEYTTIDPKKLDKILKRDIYWDAEQCLEYGVIDEII
jgi:ATP-dependent Clp protease, protease subunit